jgi:hypothetical protein
MMELLAVLERPAETRQLVARDRRRPAGDDLIVIDEGEADRLRPACKAGDMVCPVGECPHPALSTRGGTRRDHFFHLNGRRDSHGPERLAHQLGKAKIARWARGRHAGLDVQVEATIETGQRADVLITSPASGARLAIEIQCSPLTAAAWRARHELYLAAGVCAQWLWWNQPPHLGAARGEQHARPGIAREPSLLEAVRNAGLEWIWFDPGAEVLAAALDDTRLARPLRCPAGGWWGKHVGMVAFTLADCALTEHGLTAPVLERLAAERDRLADEDAARTAREAAERQAAEHAARRAFQAALATLPAADDPAVIRLLEDIVDGGAVLGVGVCEALLRLQTVRYPGTVGAPADTNGLGDLLERAARDLGVRSLPPDIADRALRALRTGGWIDANRIAGSWDAPPGSELARRRLETRARPQATATPSPRPPQPRGVPPRQRRPDPSPGEVADGGCSAHRQISDRGPRLALIEAREQRGPAGSRLVLEHLLVCERCRRHPWGAALSYPLAADLTHAAIKIPADAGAQRLRALTPEEAQRLHDHLVRQPPPATSDCGDDLAES